MMFLVVVMSNLDQREVPWDVLLTLLCQPVEIKKALRDMILWNIGVLNQPRHWFSDTELPAAESLQALKSLGGLTDFQRSRLLGLITDELKAKGEIQSEETKELNCAWLAEHSLSSMEALIGAAHELHQNGEETLRVGMIASLLGRYGRVISNPSSIVRHLQQKQDPWVELVSESVGRGGLVFKLSERGRLEAQTIRDSILQRITPTRPPRPTKT